MIYGSLEAGGTKMICAICKEDGEILEQISIPTTSPDETIPAIIAYFKDKDIAALGIACFGPIDLHKSSPMDILPVLQKSNGRITPFCRLFKRRSPSPAALIPM